MEALQNWIDDGEHEKILGMKEEWAAPYRAIAAIHLNQFDTALQLVEKQTFEHAYVLYRMKRHRHALRILNKLARGVDVDILKSQCLYNLGYYGEAYKCLASRGNTDEFAVNMAAISSMGKLSEMGRYKPLACAPKYKGPLPDIKIIHKFNDPECKAEYEYNMLFTHLHNTHEYLKLLGELDQRCNGGCQPVSKQIQLLCDKEVIGLNRREQETVDFNLKKGYPARISNPVHFQKNYIPNTEESHLVCASMALTTDEHSIWLTNKFAYKDIHPDTDAAKLMKAFLYVKTRRDINKDYLAGLLKDCGDCPAKEILLLLSSGLEDQSSQKLATKILLNNK